MCIPQPSKRCAAQTSLYIVLQTLRSTAATLATLTALATLTETPSFMLKPTLRAGEEADPNCLHLDVQYTRYGQLDVTALHSTQLADIPLRHGPATSTDAAAPEEQEDST